MLYIQCSSKSVVLNGMAWGWGGNPRYTAWMAQEMFWIYDHNEDGILRHFVQRKQLHDLLNTDFFIYIFQARRILQTALNGKLILL